MLKNSRIKNIKKSSMLLFVVLLFVLSAFGATASGWYDTNWQYRKDIYIDHTKVSAALSDFPVLIDITDSDLTKAQNDGDDILFTDDTDTKLSHEIELYNSTTGHLVAWVKVSSLSDTTDTIIHLYYGNAVVSNQEDVTNVWDSDYAMVQHLEEISGNVLDSTTNGNNGIPQGGVTYDADGNSNGAIQFDGIDDTIPTDVYPSDSDKTLEAWIKFNNFPTGEQDMTMGCNDQADHRFYVGYDEGAFFYAFGDTFQSTSDLAGVSEGEWAYFVLTGDGSNANFYVNGQLESTTTYSQTGSSTAQFHIGSRTYGENASNFIDGVIDEVRISYTDRSAEWIETSYNNYKPSFFKINEELSYTDSPAIYNPNPGDGSFGKDLNPELSAVVEDFQGNLMTITFQTDASGSWQDIQVYNNAGSKTYTANPTNMDQYATEYNWRVIADDGTYDTTKNYVFTTKSQWWNNEWRNRKLITVDHTKLNFDINNFPLLIDIDDSALDGIVQNDARGVVFVTPSGTKLDHEIESYEDGHLVAWVKTDISTSSDTALYMYYGNPNCEPQENPEAVWNSNYVGVWHLNDALDSTSNDNDGTKKSATEPQATSSIIDGGQEYDGSDDYINVGSSVLPIGSKTINTWVKMPPVGENPGGSDQDYIFYSKSDTTFFFYFNDGLEIKILGTGGDFIYPYAVDNNAWHNVVFTRDGTTAKLYIDGSEVHSISNAVNSVSSGIEYIGGETANVRGWLGGMDEIRISNVARNSDWIETSYNIVKNKDAIFGFGDEEINPNFTGKAFVSNPYPENGSDTVPPNPTLSIDVTDFEGDNMDITFETDASGSWQVIQTYTGVGDGTYTANPTNMDQTDTIYNWRINVTDDGSNELVSKTFSPK